MKSNQNIKNNGKQKAGMGNVVTQNHYDHSHHCNSNRRYKHKYLMHVTEDGELISLSLAAKEARKVLTVKSEENGTTVIYGPARVKQLTINFDI